MNTDALSGAPESMVTASNVDLSNCDREQVQYPGAIQPHGALLVLREPDLSVLQVSANVADLFGVAPQTLLGHGVSRLLGEEQAAQLRQRMDALPLDGPAEHLLRVFLRPGGPDARSEEEGGFEAFAHRRDGVLILELETAGGGGPLPLAGLYGEVRQCVERLRAARSMQAFFDTVVHQVRRLTGFERVNVYQFMEDRSGLVRAESRSAEQASYLGLRFPASDVPQPAHRLLRELWFRHLPDAAYQPVPLVPAHNPLTGAPLDLSHALLRSTSPLCNRFYLNMGARATLILTLLKDGALWGFIGCHHGAPTVVPHETRAACESLAHMISLLLAAKEEAEQAGEALAAKSGVERLIEAMTREDLYHLGLVRCAPVLMECVAAQGAAILVGAGVTLLGRTPDESQTAALAGWLATQPALFATDCLSEHYPPAAAFRDLASGLLGVRLPEDSGHLLWFRPEQVQEVQWAGDPVKPVEIDERNGLARLGPRRSFDVWKETIHGRSRPWLGYQREAAASCRAAIASLHRVERLAQANRSLTHSNQALAQGNAALDSFAYTAAHDLKEPLRGIGWHAARLQQGMAASLPEEERTRVEGIRRLAKRMDGLIEALLNYSRLAQVQSTPVPVDMNQVVSEALDSLGSRIEASRTDVRVQPGLPILVCDPIRMHQVFVNLIANAIKYNDRDQKVVEIGMYQDAASVFFVKDNGIGIAPEQRDAIFGIFRRLHGREAYGGGIGAGLTIVKRIIEHQGGTIWVESRPGEGSTFYFSVPAG